MSKVSKKTKAIFDEGEKLQGLVDSEGWKIARRKLFEKITDLNAVLGIEGKTNEEIVREVGVRQLAVKVLMDWLRAIEGEVGRHKSNREVFKDAMLDSYIYQENIEEE